jgi:hypothetical protein
MDMEYNQKLEKQEEELLKNEDSMITEQNEISSGETNKTPTALSKSLKGVLIETKKSFKNSLVYMAKFTKKPLLILESSSLGWQESLVFTFLQALLCALIVILSTVSPALGDDISSYLPINRVELFFMVFLVSLILQITYTFLIFIITLIFYRSKVEGNLLLRCINGSVQTSVFFVLMLIITIPFVLLLPAFIIPILVLGLLSEVILSYSLFTANFNGSRNSAFYLTSVLFTVQSYIFMYIVVSVVMSVFSM